MAGRTACFVCKSTLESYENVVSLWSAQNVNPPSITNGFKPEPCLCHHDCFICSVCSSLLEEKSQAYSVSSDKRLFCSKHYHCQNTEDSLLTEVLNNFKARSLDLKAALESNDCTESTFENDVEISGCNCSCNKPKYVARVTGYWIECTSKDCAKRQAFAKAYERRFKSCYDLGSSRVGGHVNSVVPEEFYREYFYGVKHWSYCAKEDDVGVILFTLKPESSPLSKGYYRWVNLQINFHVLKYSYSVHFSVAFL